MCKILSCVIMAVFISIPFLFSRIRLPIRVRSFFIFWQASTSGAPDFRCSCRRRQWNSVCVPSSGNTRQTLLSLTLLPNPSETSARAVPLSCVLLETLSFAFLAFLISWKYAYFPSVGVPTDFLPPVNDLFFAIAAPFVGVPFYAVMPHIIPTSYAP